MVRNPPLHALRNVIVATTAAASAASRCYPDAAFHHALKLRPRTAHAMRPFTDDEILLLRVHAALTSRRRAVAEPANVYALTDGGLTPGQTTSISLSSFNDAEVPTQVRIPGHRKGTRTRHMLFDEFNTLVLGRRTRAAVAAGMTDAEPLTYRPRKNLPGTADAAASAQRILDRVIEETGLRQPDITASSITRWRILTIYNHAGSRAATQAYGRKSPD